MANNKKMCALVIMADGDIIVRVNETREDCIASAHLDWDVDVSDSLKGSTGWREVEESLREYGCFCHGDSNTEYFIAEDCTLDNGKED